MIFKFSGIIWYTFIFEVPFLPSFCTNFWKRVHNLREIVNIQGLFVLIVGYVDMTMYSLTKHHDIIERVYFIYWLFILHICTLSCLLFLHTVSWKYKRDYLHASIKIVFYIMFYIINMMKKHRLFYATFVLMIHKISQLEPATLNEVHCS